MTNEERNAALIEHGSTMVKAQYEAYLVEQAAVKLHEELHRLGRVWADAAVELEGKLADAAPADASEQYDCFVASCEQQGLDPEHDAFEPQRKLFERMRQAEAGNPDSDTRLELQLPNSHLN